MIHISYIYSFAYHQTFCHLIMATLQACSIGEFEDSLCHKTFHTRGRIGLIQASELSKKDVQLLIWMDLIRKRLPFQILIKDSIPYFSASTLFSLHSYKLFCISDYLVRESRETFKTTGILVEIAPKKGK